MTLNGAIISKSCDGGMHVWFWEHDKKEDAFIIPLNKYKLPTSLPYKK